MAASAVDGLTPALSLRLISNSGSLSSSQWRSSYFLTTVPVFLSVRGFGASEEDMLERLDRVGKLLLEALPLGPIRLLLLLVCTEPRLERPDDAPLRDRVQALEARPQLVHGRRGLVDRALEHLEQHHAVVRRDVAHGLAQLAHPLGRARVGRPPEPDVQQQADAAQHGNDVALGHERRVHRREALQQAGYAAIPRDLVQALQHRRRRAGRPDGVSSRRGDERRPARRPQQLSLASHVSTVPRASARFEVGGARLERATPCV